MDAKKLKSMIKNPAPKASFGTDPNDPWSAKAGINETAMLDQYLSTKGVNAKYAPKNLKVAHSKTNAFKKWSRDHYDAIKKKKMMQGSVLKLHGEETEQLDELSKTTLSSYVKKASSHAAEKSAEKVRHSNISASYGDAKVKKNDPDFEAKVRGNSIKSHEWNKSSNAASQKSHKRLAGVAKAVDKLAKEEFEQLDELAPKTLRSYIRKTYNDPDRAEGAARANEKHGEALTKELASRKASGKTIHTLGSITRKLRGEEVESIDEVSSELLQRYKEKANKSADELHDKAQYGKSVKRRIGVMKATGKQIEKTTASIAHSLRKEEADQLDESKKELSKSARMIKALYKHHKVVKEESKEEVTRSLSNPRQLLVSRSWRGFFLEKIGVKIEGIGTSTLVVHGIKEINQNIYFLLVI